MYTVYTYKYMVLAHPTHVLCSCMCTMTVCDITNVQTSGTAYNMCYAVARVP